MTRTFLSIQEGECSHSAATKAGVQREMAALSRGYAKTASRVTFLCHFSGVSSGVSYIARTSRSNGA